MTGGNTPSQNPQIKWRIKIVISIKQCSYQSAISETLLMKPDRGTPKYSGNPERELLENGYRVRDYSTPIMGRANI